MRNGERRSEMARYGSTLSVAILPAAIATFWAGSIVAQKQPEPMGAVATRDARVSGGLEVDGAIARLLTNTSITAFDRDAPVALHRGGHVLVCSTSEFHLLHSGSADALIFGLDRGAIEVFSESERQDAFLTPDLKLVPVTAGPLDLKLRVTREGDTCIDNAGPHAPVLNVTDPFSSANYRVLPGQHLLFVGGDLHKVVDHERSSCGCPPVSPQQLARNSGKPLSPAQAAAASHPFPAAQSAGLAPDAPSTNEAPVGVAGSQVTTTFSYGEGQGRPPSVGETPSSAAAASTPIQDQSKEQKGFLQAIGRFFHRLFHHAPAESSAPEPAQ